MTPLPHPTTVDAALQDHVDLDAGTRPSEVVYNIGVHDMVAAMLLLFGAFSWGVVAVFGVDPIAAVFGVMTPLARALHALVGLASVYALFTVARMVRVPQ